MKLHFLGTAAAEGIPAVFCGCELCKKARALGGKDIRTRAQTLIGDELLVDLGPDTFAHAALYGLDLLRLSTVLVTHSHSDHLYAEDLIFRTPPYGHCTGDFPLTVYGNQKVLSYIERTRGIYDDDGRLGEFVSFAPLNRFEGFESGGCTVVPLPATHDRSEDCLIFDITCLADSKRLLYANDTSLFPAETFDYLKGKRFDVVSLDCTMGADKGCYSHMSFDECIKVRQWMLENGAADADTTFVITHFSHNGGLLHDELCARAGIYGIVTAFDGMKIEI